jgi:predicted N-acetyltransferase YhbS
MLVARRNARASDVGSVEMSSGGERRVRTGPGHMPDVQVEILDSEAVYDGSVGSASAFSNTLAGLKGGGGWRRNLDFDRVMPLGLAEDTCAVIAAMPVEIWDSRYLTAEQARGIGELVHQTWPKPNMTAEDRAARTIQLGREFIGASGARPRSIVAVEEDRVVAHAWMFPRVIGTERGDIHIGALAQVCTDAAMRGRGLGELVARAAFRLVDAGEFEFSLFQTTLGVQPFYVKLGCVPVENRIVNRRAEDPAANPFWHDVVMRYPAGDGWPAGTIDLGGPGY